MKSTRICLLFAFLFVLVVPGGCSYASIRGQVVCNGVGVDAARIEFRIEKHTWILETDDGRFSIQPGTPVFGPMCQIGKPLNIEIYWGVGGAHGMLEIRDYIIMPGVNSFSKIDVGAGGFELLSPAQDQTISAWPVEFKWAAYDRPGITPRYTFELVSFDANTYSSETLYSGDCGSQTSWVLQGTEPRIQETKWWVVTVSYEINGATYFQRYSRSAALVPAP